MSELDDLAQAAESLRSVPVRRAVPPQMPPPLSNVLGGAGMRPIVIVHQQPAQQPSAPPRSAFMAGFSGTFGVVAALVTLVLAATLLMIGVVAYFSASRSAAVRAAAQHRQELAREADRQRWASMISVSTRRQGTHVLSYLRNRSGKAMRLIEVSVWNTRAEKIVGKYSVARIGAEEEIEMDLDLGSDGLEVFVPRAVIDSAELE